MKSSVSFAIKKALTIIKKFIKHQTIKAYYGFPLSMNFAPMNIAIIKDFPPTKALKKAKSAGPFSLSILYKAQTKESITTLLKHLQNSTIKNKNTIGVLVSNLLSVAISKKLNCRLPKMMSRPLLGL